jgi:phenylacetate-CoA ligase
VRSALFQHAFDHLREVREWQATQRERNRILIRFELLPGAMLDLRRARSRLDERLGFAGLRDDLDIELEVVNQLATDPATGKFRRLVSLVDNPDDIWRNCTTQSTRINAT